MKRKNLHLITGVILSLFIMLSFSSNPPNGNTGAPFDSVCSSCHSGSGGGFDGTISLSGLPSTTNAGDTYPLTYTIEYTSGTPMRAGFQATQIFDSNNLGAGDLVNEGTGSNVVTYTPSGTGARKYLEHSPAQFFGGNTSVEFTVDWIAPSNEGDVTFWATSVLGNGSGSGGDKVLFEQFSTSVSGSVPLEVDISSVSDVSCFGDSDGSATAVATGGVPPYNYQWENGETTQTATMLTSGSISVTVEDDAGTIVVETVDIDEPDPITVSTIEIDVSCFGSEDGTGIVNASGGTAPISCDWSTGSNDCSVMNLAPGTYFVTLEDANGCQEFAEIIIDEPDAIAIDFDTTDETFIGAADGTATADPVGGSPPYMFNWSNGQTGTGLEHTATGLTEGSYSVTVTDFNGCSFEEVINISGGGCALDAEATTQNISCFGDNDGAIDLFVENASEPVTYNWSDGSATQNLDNLPAGTYSVTIIDAAGCDFEISNLVISEPAELLSNTNSIEMTECIDDTTGEIIVFVGGGSGNLTIEWSNGITNDTTVIFDSLSNPIDTIINLPDTLVGLSPGVYSYDLIDIDGCFISDTIEIINIDDQAPVLSLMEGTIYLDETGNVGPADFSVVDNGSSDNCGIMNIEFDAGPFDCSSIGTYTIPVTATDAAGNSSTENATVIVVDTIPPTIDCSTLEDIVTNSCDAVTFPTPTATDNCQLISITVVEGFESGSVFPAGQTTVTFRATDDCGNFSECSFVVTVNIDLALDVNTTNVTCSGGTDGSITPLVTGGTPPYEVFINPPLNDPNNIPAGTYSINVSDAANCLVNQTVTITEPDPISVVASSIIGSDWGTGEGAIDIDVTGGTAPYLYNWVDGSNASFSTTEDLEGLEIGTYTITVIDSNGCESDAFSFDIESTSATIDAEFNNGSISVTPNPTTGLLNVLHKNNISDLIQVISIDGMVLRTIYPLEASANLDLSDLNAGLYFLRCYDGEAITVKQFLKI